MAHTGKKGLFSFPGKAFLLILFWALICPGQTFGQSGYKEITTQITPNIKAQNFARAMELADSGYAMATRENKLKLSLEFLNSKSIIYSEVGNYSSAIEVLLQGLDMVKEGPNAPAYRIAFFTNIGIGYKNLFDYDKSLLFYRKAWDQIRELRPDDNSESDILVKIASIYIKKENLDSAQIYLQNALQCRKDDHPDSGTYHYWLSRYYLAKNECTKAMEALAITRKLDSLAQDWPKYWDDQILLAELLILEGQNEAAFSLYSRCLESARAARRLDREHAILEALYLQKLAQNDSLGSLSYLLDFILLDDSLQAINDLAKIRKLEFSYEMDLVNKRNQYQVSILKLKEEKNRLEKQLLLGISLLVIGLICFIGIKLRKKYQQNLLSNQRDLAMYSAKITSKNVAIEKAISGIRDSINDSDPKHRPNLREMQNALKLEMDHQDFWEDFDIRFQNTQPEFHHNLISLHPNLSKNEIRLCVFIKLNFSTKEISSVTKKSVGSINVAKHRLKKKLGLEKGEGVYAYLCKVQAKNL